MVVVGVVVVVVDVVVALVVVQDFVWLVRLVVVEVVVVGDAEFCNLIFCR